jgi:hypothetical protein
MNYRTSRHAVDISSFFFLHFCPQDNKEIGIEVNKNTIKYLFMSGLHDARPNHNIKTTNRPK